MIAENSRKAPPDDRLRRNPPACASGALSVLIESEPGSNPCFDAFSSREPVSTPDQVRGRLSLENALKAVAHHCRGPLAGCRQGVRGPACDPRFGTIARETILERVENAQREAGPDRRTEIKRHPGNLALPLGKVVRHDPTRAHVTQTLEKSQKLSAVGNMGPPSAQIHRDVDGDEKRQITCDP